MIAALGGVVAILEVAAVAQLTAGRELAAISFYIAVGWITMVVGAALWERRPGNRSGVLVSVMGLWILVAAVSNGDNRALYLVGFIAAEAPIAALAHLVLAYPSGRLRGPREVGIVVAAYCFTLGLQVPQYVFDSGTQVYGALRVAARDDLVHRADDLQSITGSMVIVAAAVIMTRRVGRIRRGSHERRHLRTVYAYGTATIVFLPISANIVRPALDLSALTLFQMQVVALLGVPLVFCAAVLRGNFVRMGGARELDALLSDGSSGSGTALQTALADVLGDPTVKLRQPADESVPSDPDDTSRAVVELRTHDGVIGTISYDANLIADPEIVRRAGRIATLVLERERSAIELIAGRQAVLDSRARVLEFADEQRRNLARDLHDALQNRLVIAAMHAGTLGVETTESPRRVEAAQRLRSELAEAIDEVRRLSNGVMPTPLIERGLFAAAEDLLDRLPIPTVVDIADDHRPIDPTIASTGYFVLAEAVSNSIKHADASTIQVGLRRLVDEIHLTITDDGIGGAVLDAGRGLRGMVDRIDALNGHIAITSPAGGGTTIRIRLPCAF